MRERAGMMGWLLETGARAASRAARAIIDSAPGREAAAAAVGLAQRGKKRLEEAQDRVLHALGLAAREDYHEVARRMARLKRKMRDLSRRVEADRRGALETEGRDAPGGAARQDGAAPGDRPEDGPRSGGEPR